MRGDEIEAGGELRERRGPRHAAPRKSLLSKLQRPAGKAMALAAMPTAVFVGMGLTPRAALADDKDIPFAPGPCVTRSDEPVEEENPTPSAKPEPTPTATREAEPEPEPSPSGSADPGGDTAREPVPSPSAEADDATEEGARAAGEAVEAVEPEEEPDPEPSRTRNPLDPLGIGDALRDLFDGPGEETAAAPEEAPEPAADASPAQEPTGEPTGEPASEPAVEQPAEETSREPSAKQGAGTGPGAAEEAIREAADAVGAEVEELDEDAKGLEPRADEDIPDGAKPRFPCPTADPEALADAQLEPGIPLLPDDPWILESSMLTLSGLDYHGIVEVRTSSGKVKKALKFTASSVDIRDLHQLTVGPAGSTAHVKARSGSTSTIRNGTVTMYTEELKGNLFGIIPITFSPETPPPLNVPFAMFTSVKVKQAGQFGGTLKIPGLQNYFTGGA
ncbi:hypothetical protein NPS70_05910 [Streptomyces sp. C10-9-1]|uniref:hypothetical protein n=1 Tax=Streptomyces sp. C10-9-1 TaxID=1859285 RepID=UPI0021123B0F|nr:hypothetical protein [Streptomyces sp. C10-9-1]MCQ6552734.1 hypothetical protein [Streptomyces sp. C10-9-1]